MPLRVPSRLLAVNTLLGGVSLACVGFIVWELVAPLPSPEMRPRPAPAAAPAPPVDAPPASAAAYNVVAARNLFSPTRSEAPLSAADGAGSTVVKLNLHGVVLRDQNPVAYLEDPQTKRVAGYRVGDAIAGGTVQTIAADRVVIARPDGLMDVRLRDPSKPRPAAPAAPPAGLTAPVPGAPAAPAVPQPQVRGAPGAPGTMVGPFLPPSRRPPLSLGRSLSVPPMGAVPPPLAPQQ